MQVSDIEGVAYAILLRVAKTPPGSLLRDSSDIELINKHNEGHLSPAIVWDKNHYDKRTAITKCRTPQTLYSKAIACVRPVLSRRRRRRLFQVSLVWESQ